MALYAADDIDDALAATRRLFTPVRVALWARLALLALFIGGGTTPPATGFQFAGSPSGGSGGELPAIGSRTVLLLVAAAVVGVLLLLALGALASVFEFVFVEALREGTVSVRRGVARHWRAGLRLFGFRIAVGLLSLLAVGLLIAAVFAPLFLGLPGVVVVLLLLVSIPLFVVVAVVLGIVNGFTTVFVVPTVLRTERGVLASWRRLWSTVRAHPKQYVAYAVIGFVLNLATGLLVGIVAAIAFAVVAVPGLIAFAVVAASPVFLVVAVAVWVVLGLFALAAVAATQAPAQAFLRYHAMFVLGDVDADLDYIPEVRRAVRS